MRARLIKQGFWMSEDVASLTFFERLLFQGLWCLADRRGVVRWSARRAKAELFPYDDIVSDDCLTGVRHMSDAGLTVLYHDAEGVEYVHVTGFSKHQVLTTVEKKRGELVGPLPTDEGCVVVFGAGVSDGSQTGVRRESDDTDTDTDTDTEWGGSCQSDVSQMGTESVRKSEGLDVLVELVRGSHEECGRLKDFVVVELVKGEGLDWKDACDQMKIREAVAAFGRDWDGAVFAGHVTPQKELRKYLRHARSGRVASGGSGLSGKKESGGVIAEAAGGAPVMLVGGVS